MPSERVIHATLFPLMVTARNSGLVLTGITGGFTGASCYWRGWLVLLGWLCPVLICLAESVSVDVNGVEGALAKNVERHVSLLGLSDRDSVRFQRALIVRSARRALEALGYYDAEIEVILSPPEEKDVELTLNIRVDEPVHWADTRVTLSGPGMDDPLFDRIIKSHSPKVGDVLNHQVYEDLKKALRTQALSFGYFDAVLTRHKLLIDRTEHTARMDMELSTGVRYRFGKVQFTTETVLNDDALQRLIPFREGDYYDEAKVTEFNRNLLDTGFFNTVGMFPHHDKASSESDAVVPVDVELEDSAFNRVSMGLGYGTDTGPRVRLSWLMPLLNQYGHSLQFATSLSEPRQEFTSEYKIPDGKPGTDFWSLQAGYLEEVFEDNQYRQVSSGVSRQQLVWGEWTRTYMLKFKREHGSIDGEMTTTTPSDGFYVTPGLSLSQLVVDHQIRPNGGYRLNLDVEFSDPAIASDAQYSRVVGLAKWLAALSERQQILMRLQLGMLWSDDFNQVPVSARFYAGGDQSIRGYDYNSLGPRDADDALIGGTRLAVASVEYLYRFLPNWKAALFVDHGGATDDTTDTLYTGAGLGVRWISPVGQISFDVADPVTTGEKLRIHITMGTVL